MEIKPRNGLKRTRLLNPKRGQGKKTKLKNCFNLLEVERPLMAKRPLIIWHVRTNYAHVDKVRPTFEHLMCPFLLLSIQLSLCICGP